MANEALTNDSTPTLTWTAVSGANLYHAQISLKANFSSLVAEDNALASESYTPTISTDDSKYYWRFRSSTDGGSTWSQWSEVYSFWYNSAFSTTVTPTTWMLVKADDVTDTYTLGVYPKPHILPFHVNRSDRRTLSGGLLVDHVGTKDEVVLEHDEAWISAGQRDEFMRFFNLGEVFFLLGVIDNGDQTVEKTWKAFFSDKPEFEPLATGRNDYFRVRLPFKEV